MAAPLLDMDRVLYQGEHAATDALKTVLWLCEQRIPHLLLTNTTSRPLSSLVEKLAGLVIQTDAVLDSIDEWPSWWKKMRNISSPRAPPLGEMGRDESRWPIEFS